MRPFLNRIVNALRPAIPWTSIIIVTRNNWAFTRACLGSIYRHTPRRRYEIIAVDNGSTDGTPDELTELAKWWPHFHPILNRDNRGFAAANNQGLRRATGRLLVLLNNDTLVTPGWVHGLAHWLRDPNLGIIGPVTNCIGNEARIPARYRTHEELERFAEELRLRNAGKSFDIAMLAMYCVAFRRDVFAAVGELDEQFQVGMFEDDDYALRVRRAGKRVVCVEDVFIHHHGGATFGKLPHEELLRIHADNRARFEKKWGVSWSQHTHRPGTEFPPLASVSGEQGQA